jgi:hypothetical protein
VAYEILYKKVKKYKIFTEFCVGRNSVKTLIPVPAFLIGLNYVSFYKVHSTLKKLDTEKYNLKARCIHEPNALLKELMLPP